MSGTQTLEPVQTRTVFDVASLYPKEITVEANNSPDLGHYYCAECYPEGSLITLSYCGIDVSQEDEIPEESQDEVDCVVCIDLKYCPDNPEH